MLAKLEKFVFLALIFSIPFQKRHFLFGPSPYGENFWEWGSGFIYFTDFLVLILFVFWLKSLYAKLSFGLGFWAILKEPLHPATAGWRGLVLFGLLFFSFLSLTQADLVNIAVYRFVKLDEFVFLFFYVTAQVVCNSRDSKNCVQSKINAAQILWTFIASGVFQSIIAILQFARQSSLGLEIFHESTLAIHMKGVAHIMSSDGSFLIRAYGTFPSPNVLAGFLGLCLLFLWYLYIRGVSENTTAETFATPARSLIQSSARSPIPSFLRKLGMGTMPARLRVFCSSILRNPLIICTPIVFLLSFSLILTFSRGAIVFFVLVSALFFAGMFLIKQFHEYKKQAKILASLVIVSWLLVIAAAWPEVSSRFLRSSFDEPAIQERLFFNEVGLHTAKQGVVPALFGIGIGNFVHNFKQVEPGLPDRLYQPVHNLFILIASEIGTLGFFAFVLFIALLLERAIKMFFQISAMCKLTDDLQIAHDRELFANHLYMHIHNCLMYKWTLLVVFGFFLLIAMYDHYFWTLQQGGLIFWVTLGLIAGVIRKYN